MSNLEPTLQEVIDTVYEINEGMPESVSDIMGDLLIVTHNDYQGTYIKMLGYTLWSSDNDCRDYLVDGQCDEIEEKKDLKQYLEEQVYNICKLILKGLDV